MAFGSLSPFTRSSAAARGEDDPFRTMRREVERLFDDFGGAFGLPAGGDGDGRLMMPRIDVAETETGLEVTADLPGLEAKDIEVDVSDGTLTLRAERREEREKADEKKTWHVVERREGTYLRRLPLPFDPDPEKVEARFDKGVLKIALPRPPEAQKKSKRIEIKGA